MSSSHRTRSGDETNKAPRLAEDDEPILLPPVDNSSLMNRFKNTIIGRTFCSEGRSTELLLAVMPKAHIWDVEGRVRGFDLGNGRFQFDFDSEGDLKKVLNKRPCHINRWSLALERWQPNVSIDYPNKITFWVQTKGLPREFWTEEALKRIGKSLGDVVSVDEKTGKIEASVDVTRPLRFEKKAIGSNGEEHLVLFKYEKLHRYCFTCKMISHEERSCPNLTEEERFKLRAERSALASKEAEEEELFRVPQTFNRNMHFSSSDQTYREAPRRDSHFSFSELDGKYNERKQEHYPTRERRMTEISNSLPMTYANSHRTESPRDSAYVSKDPHRDRYQEKRAAHSSQDYYAKDQEHKPVWQRLEPNHYSSYPRYRENLNHLNSDYRKRRHVESVATSSWIPKSPRYHEEVRSHKVQRLESGSNRDARQLLDKKRSSFSHHRVGSREPLREALSPRKSVRKHPTYKEKGKGILPEEDGSRTVTASDLRHHRPSGTVYYREKDPKSPLPKISLVLDSGLKVAAAASVKSPQGNLKVISPIKENVQEKPPVRIITEEEELQIQKDLEEMKERHKSLSAEEKKIMQEKADELYAQTMLQEEIDNDDLLDDVLQDGEVQMSGEHTVSEQIKPVSRGNNLPTSPSLSSSSKKNPPSSSRRPVKERLDFSKGSLSKSAHRRRRAENRRRASQTPLELPGVASKKRNILSNGSPKKRSEHKSQTLRSHNGKPSSTVPRTGVFPSSVNKRTKSRSGLVGSQNPPSKIQ